MNVSIDDLKKLMAELKEESYSQDELINSSRFAFYRIIRCFKVP